MAPVLAQQLLMALHKPEQAEVEYAKARSRNKHALNKKRYLLRAAKLRRKGAKIRIQGVKEEFKSKRCLFLHNMEHVHAVMELLNLKGFEKRGCL